MRETRNVLRIVPFPHLRPQPRLLQGPSRSQATENCRAGSSDLVSHCPLLMTRGEAKASSGVATVSLTSS